MPRIIGTTDHQSAFLRALATNPFGPPPDAWPSPAILRRWLRKPPFRRALDSIRDTLRYQSDLRLAYAADSATHDLQHPDSSLDAKSKIENQKSKLTLIRLSHLRQRFPAPTPPTPQRPIRDEIEFLSHIPADTPLGDALAYLRQRQQELLEQPSPNHQPQGEGANHA